MNVNGKTTIKGTSNNKKAKLINIPDNGLTVSSVPKPFPTALNGFDEKFELVLPCGVCISGVCTTGWLL
jgi:hypothetical protein